MATYFKASEFDSRLQPGSGVNMNKEFLAKLNKGREIYGKPIAVTSGYRVRADYERLKKQGYEPSMTSAHFIGRAADIRPVHGVLDTWVEWLELLEAMWSGGFQRFGIMNNTLHVDDDPGKRSPATWRYANTNDVIYENVVKWVAEKRKGIKLKKRK
jgi:rhodanese-related sulfurtransferase